MPSSLSRLDNAEVEARPLNAAVSDLFHATSPEAFAVVCDALADVADVGEELDRARFLDAVDRAQNHAMACGLIHTIGQDVVQAIMVQSFRRCCVHQRSSAEPRPKYEAAESTVEALMHTLREHGTHALSDRSFLDRLANLSSDQTRDAIKRLSVLRPRSPNITDELLFKLGGLL
jgi:hypothetical protein